MSGHAWVSGTPTPKGRPRFDPISGRVYTPKRTKQAEEMIGWEWKVQNTGWEVLAGEVRVILTVCAPRINHPDLDNVLKLVLDALNGVAWEDDRQVTEISALWTKTEDKVGMAITVEAVT